MFPGFVTEDEERDREGVAAEVADSDFETVLPTGGAKVSWKVVPEEAGGREMTNLSGEAAIIIGWTNEPLPVKVSLKRELGHESGNPLPWKVTIPPFVDTADGDALLREALIYNR